MAKHNLVYSSSHNVIMYTVMLTLITMLIIDLMISNVADIYSEIVKSSFGVLLFIAISIVSIVGQVYFFVRLNEKTIKEVAKVPHLRYAIWTTQLILTSIIILVILQILLSSYYFTDLLIVSTTISYSLTIAIMIILAWRFIIWFKANRNLALLLYGCAAAVIVFNSVFTIILFDFILWKKPPLVTLNSDIIFDLGYEPGTFMSWVLSIQAYSLTAFMILAWGGTVMIMYHNISRIGKTKFWALVLLPIVYYLSYFVTLYQEIYPESVVTKAISENFAIPILAYTASTIVCGMLFGLVFILIARSIRLTSRIREYMLFTGFGFMLFFITGTSTVLQAAYPPLGLNNVSLVGLSSYLIFFGLYHSALSITHDVKLRQLVHDSVTKDTKFLKSIGDAQLAGELEKTVLDITKKRSVDLIEEIGEEPSMSEEEIKKYIQYVVQEIQTKEKMS